MVEQNLADKCRRWVEEYAGAENPTIVPPSRYRQITPNNRTTHFTPSYDQNTARDVSNRTERHVVRPTCYLERHNWIDKDYHLVEVANMGVGINVRSRLCKFNEWYLERVFGQFGEVNIKYGYLFLPKLFCLITGIEPTYYLDKDAETHLESLLSQLKENAIRKAEAIDAELVVMERDEINVKVDFSGLVHLATILVGCEYSFWYNANARAEFYRRNT